VIDAALKELYQHWSEVAGYPAIWRRFEKGTSQIQAHHQIRLCGFGPETTRHTIRTILLEFQNCQIETWLL
jgi:hypothetical protein